MKLNSITRKYAEHFFLFKKRQKSKGKKIRANYYKQAVKSGMNLSTRLASGNNIITAGPEKDSISSPINIPIITLINYPDGSGDPKPAATRSSRRTAHR